MDKIPDYYKILSIEPDADVEQIKRAYKEKALQYHPDVNKHENALEEFQLINQAYRTIINSERRRKYDVLLKFGQILETAEKDIRFRHPADAGYFRRRQQPQRPTQTRNTSKSIRGLNHFIFYSITAILVVGIIYGVIDLFENLKFGGLLFTIVTLVVIFLGVRIINKEKSKK